MLLCVGTSVAHLFYLLFPHGQPLRPIITDNDVFSRVVRDLIYANDTNTNCCPSLHVLDQLAVHIGLCKSKLCRDRKGWKTASLVMTVLICASTVFVKQHSILDVIAALLLEIPLYLLIFKVDWGRVFQPAIRRPQKTRCLRKTERRQFFLYKIGGLSHNHQ